MKTRRIFPAFAFLLLAACSGAPDRELPVEVLQPAPLALDIRAQGQVRAVNSTPLKVPGRNWTRQQLSELLPDGSADFISHRPSELPRAIRWLTRNGDEDALGLVLPATSEVDGKTAERKKGNIQTLAGGAHWRAHLRFGALSATDAAAMVGAIAAVRD